MRSDIRLVVIAQRRRRLEVVRRGIHRPGDGGRVQPRIGGDLGEKAPVARAGHHIGRDVPHPPVVHLVLIVRGHLAGIVLAVGVGDGSQTRLEMSAPESRIPAHYVLPHGILGRLLGNGAMVAGGGQGGIALVGDPGIHPGRRGKKGRAKAVRGTIMHCKPPHGRILVGRFVWNDSFAAAHKRCRRTGGGEAEGIPERYPLPETGAVVAQEHTPPTFGIAGIPSDVVHQRHLPRVALGQQPRSEATQLHQHPVVLVQTLHTPLVAVARTHLKLQFGGSGSGIQSDKRGQPFCHIPAKTVYQSHLLHGQQCPVVFSVVQQARYLERGEEPGALQLLL